MALIDCGEQLLLLQWYSTEESEEKKKEEEEEKRYRGKWRYHHEARGVQDNHRFLLQNPC
jgi:hypothetical protein